MIYKEIVDRLQHPLHCSKTDWQQSAQISEVCTLYTALYNAMSVLVRIDISQQVEVLPSLLNVKLLSVSPRFSIY